MEKVKTEHELLAESLGPLRARIVACRAAAQSKGNGADALAKAMSAHLAELTRVTPDSALDILLLSRFLMDRTQWGTPYHVAALVIFTELANELGLNAGGPLVVRGRVRRERVATLTLEITSKPPNEVAAAAKKIWERLYGEPLLDVETRLIVQRPVWRH